MQRSLLIQNQSKYCYVAVVLFLRLRFCRVDNRTVYLCQRNRVCRNYLRSGTNTQKMGSLKILQDSQPKVRGVKELTLYLHQGGCKSFSFFHSCEWERDGSRKWATWTQNSRMGHILTPDSRYQIIMYWSNPGQLLNGCIQYARVARNHITLSNVLPITILLGQAYLNLGSLPWHTCIESLKGLKFMSCSESWARFDPSNGIALRDWQFLYPHIAAFLEVGST